MDLLPLVCLCVLTWSRRTFVDADGPFITKITVEEDNDVVLPCSFGTSDIRNKFFDWKKDGQKEVFFFNSGKHYNNGLTGQDVDFRGRVSHFPDSLQSGNASIRINTVKVSDKGTYTCDFPSDGGLRSQIELVVGACPEPVVSSKRTNEGMQVQCHVKGASTEPEVELWRSPGEVVHVPDGNKKVSQKGNLYNVILSSIVTQEGEYWCVVKQREICHQTESIHIDVNIPGACPKPSASLYKKTDGMQVQCETEGASTEPEVELWRSPGEVVHVPDGNKKVSQKGNLYNVILSSIVTQEGEYWCVVKQRDICNQTESKHIHVNIPGPQNSQDGGSNTSRDVTITFIITAFLIGLVIFVLVKTKRITMKCRNGSESPKPGEEKELNSHRSDL